MISQAGRAIARRPSGAKRRSGGRIRYGRRPSWRSCSASRRNRARAVAGSGARGRRRRADSARRRRSRASWCCRAASVGRDPRLVTASRRRTLVRYICCTSGARSACERAAGFPVSNARLAIARRQPSRPGAIRRDLAWTQNTPPKCCGISIGSAVPDAPAWASSWAEWLYFNGRSPNARFYLTFIVGPMSGEDRRDASVRLQLDRGNGVENYDETHPITHGAALSALRPHDRRELRQARRHCIPHSPRSRGPKRRARGRGSDGRRLAWPSVSACGIHGRARMAHRIRRAGDVRALNGALDVNGERISLDDGVGYHDHNWGILERRVVAVGTGPARRVVAAMRPHLSPARRRRSRQAAGLPRRRRAQRSARTRPTSRLPKQTTNGASRAPSP